MHTEIPLFPLAVFLLPGEKSKIHIFEPRYKQLLKDCEESQSLFGIPFILNNSMSEYGSVVKVTNELATHADGSSDIEILCTDIFKIKSYHPQMGEKLYPGGNVILLNTESSQPVSENLMSELGKYLQESDQALTSDMLSIELDAYGAGRIIPLNGLEKIQLVKAGNPRTKEKILLNKLKILSQLQKQIKSIDHNIFLN